jgi:hypothetical protein
VTLNTTVADVVYFFPQMKRALPVYIDENAATPRRSVRIKRLRHGTTGLKLIDNNIPTEQETPCVPKYIGKQDLHQGKASDVSQRVSLSE